jgi:hypothetical protein
VPGCGRGIEFMRGSAPVAPARTDGAGEGYTPAYASPLLTGLTDDLTRGGSALFSRFVTGRFRRGWIAAAGREPRAKQFSASRQALLALRVGEDSVAADADKALGCAWRRKRRRNSTD